MSDHNAGLVSAAEFEFDLRLAEADRQGYYYTRWDLAQPITVRGENQKEAAAKAEKVLGPAQTGRYWVYRCDAIREVAPLVTASAHQALRAEVMGLADSLDDSVIADEGERMTVYFAILRVLGIEPQERDS